MRSCYGVYVMAAHADAVGGDDFKLAKFLFLISYLFGLINETCIIYEKNTVLSIRLKCCFSR